ncbi:MAG: hypothetical protein AAFO89_14610 [Planctomycetota bacterium]
MNRFGAVCAAVCVSAGLSTVGCAPVRIKCVVLEGELSTIAVVSASDPRFDEAGVEGAEIVVRQTGRAGDVIVRTTNANGHATIPLAGTGALSRPLSVEVSAEGYIPARIEQMPTPTPGRGLLILVEPIGGDEP